MSANALFWEKITAGRLWHMRRLGAGPILGFVRFNSNAWDSYICTGKKWPEGDQSVNRRGIKRDYWSARRDVEYALSKSNSPTVS
jgi:hypothetical protein